ncbi:beta-N-acetylglucosaminidase domain-containing protein [Clostridium sp.]|uniref:beta-N-acetylglucosaminidase domain-containing protein n=1 Tax=Clostridium sp. TaxID=1506 RepID=UPI002624D9A5|nr:beta-N-acetylglucosaminidase domain-containing protein [Clostridium sp.]
MRREMLKRLLATTMVSIFIINGLTITKVDAFTDKNNQVSISLPKLNPAPKNIEVNEEILTITSTVNLQGKDLADEDAIRVLKEFLSENNIVINESYDESSTTLIIGEVEDDIKEMDEAKERIGVSGTEGLKDEGYVLAVDSNDGRNGTILIEGKDEDGTFYGVKTLTQMITNTGSKVYSNDVVITDEPNMKTRGIVEGFYGTPWTHEDRLDQIRFYGENKMNTYIYAPKDDPYHRENWRDEYPESEMKRMNELIKTSNENKVDFVFAISPGIDIRFDGEEGEEDFQALVSKCESLYDMGVRSFAILFDDINNKDGVKQAELLNRFNEEFIKAKGDVKPLITVPTEYDTHVMGGSIDELKQYTKDFSSTLSSDIMVMWTGSVVVPEGIDKENVDFVKAIYGDRMGIWWNYPVTDYMKEKLALGPVYNVDTSLGEEIDFFVMNPMEHAELSKIALSTGADYAWNTSEYDYQESWKKSIEMMYGDLAPYMITFADHSSRMEASWASTGRGDAPEVRQTMDELLRKIVKGQDVTTEIEILNKEFKDMIEAADVLKKKLPDNILSHCRENLDKLKLLGENDKLALDYLIAKRDKNTLEVERLEDLLNDNLSSLNSGKKLSEKTALEFITEALNIDFNAKANFDVSSTFVVPGQEVKFTNLSSMASSEFEWTFKGVNIETSTEENPTVVYEKEGIYSVTLKAKNILGNDVIVKEGLITVSNSANTEKTNLALGKSVTASSSVAGSEAPEMAVDGKSNTKWCANKGNTHTLTIDLGKIDTITDVVIKHSEAGGESASMNTKAYRILTSLDGENYNEVVNVTNNTAGVTTDKIPVTKAKYVKLIVDEPTQGSDNAARIYEVEVMGVEGDIELPPIYVVPGEEKEPIVYPVPQETIYLSEEGMELVGDVNVVIHGEQEEATLGKLEEILKENNISYNISEEVANDKANIVLTSDKNHCDNCVDTELLEDEALKNKEGYVIKTSNDENDKGNISIVAADSEGAYYGVLSLGQILEKASNNKIVEVVISDYPEIEFRGFIEGFYGTPWSHEDRISLMKDTSEYKMNTYIYAPKDDPYHRSNWKDLYPKEEAKQIQELAKVGTENNINFCWTIHPGATLQFTEDDFDALIAKYEQLYDLGVRQFGVLFDDTDDWVNGQKQAEWINRIDTEFVKAKGDVAPMIVISARYNSAWGPNMDRYFKPFMETLHSDIQVMWTGHATMSNISKDVMEWPKTQTGVDKDLAVWWNYPVNDYCDSRILMAPLHNLSTDLNNVSGFFSNPMNQAEASKVALYSIADYTWNTDEFDYMKSWENSIEKLVPEIKEEFMRFASNICYLKDDGGASGAFEYDESWYLAEKIDALKSAIYNNEQLVDKANDLLTEFNIIVSDYDVIKENINNDNLFSEIEPFLNSYKALGEAGVAAMQALIVAEEGKIEKWLDNSNLANEKLDLMDTFTVDRLEDGTITPYTVAVGEKRLKPLINEVITVSRDIISKTIFKEITPKVISSIKDLNIDVKFENGEYTIGGITALELNKDEYVGIALPKANKLSKVIINASDYEGLVLEYSLNGIEWSEAETNITDGVMSSNNSIVATFVRIVNKGDNKKTIDVNKIVPDADDNYVELVTGDLEGRVDYLYDGDLSTAFEAEINKTTQSLVYKMTRITNVGNILFLQDKDNISQATVSVKNTNGVWKKVGILGKQLSDIEVNDDILEVKIEFDINNPSPKIYEIVVNENTEVDEEVFKDHLQIAVDMANEITDEDLEKIVPIVAEEFKESLAKAIEVLNNSNATQEEVNAAFDRLAAAMQKLSFYKGDKEKLINLIDKISKLNKDEFIPSTWNNLEIVLSDVNKIIDDVNALENEVKEGYNKLVKAYLELRLKPNKDKLQDLINKAEALDSSKYTEESFSNVVNALEMAKLVLANEDATEEEVNNTKSALELSLGRLVEKSTDKPGDNNSNNDDNSSNNVTNGSNSSGNSNNSTNTNKNYLPKTGGSSAGVIGVLGVMISAIGASLFKKKK